VKLIIINKICLNETCSKIRADKHLSDTLPLQNGLKQGDALSLLFFSFTLERVIKKVEENQAELKLNATHRLPMYADDVNMLGVNINTVTNYSSLRDIGWGGMYWIHLAQNRDQWRALVNTVMNLRVP
jgi:hypothetical protein